MASPHAEIPRVQITVLNVSLILNIVLMLGIILGGLNWVSSVGVYVEKTKELSLKMNSLELRMNEVEKRHVVEDANVKIREENERRATRR